MIICCLVLLWIPAITNAATVDVNGELRLLADLNAFELERLALRMDLKLDQASGMEADIRISSQPGVFVYEGFYYQANIFTTQDLLRVGYFQIPWDNEKSWSIQGSLAKLNEPLNGAGLKYQINPGKVLVNTSLSCTANEASSTQPSFDLALRGDFPVLKNLAMGVALSAQTSGGTNTQQLLCDAIYTVGEFQALGEFLMVNQGAGNWVNGLYVEGDYHIAKQFGVYAAFSSTPGSNGQWLLAGGRYHINDRFSLQGEFLSANNTTQICFMLKVSF